MKYRLESLVLRRQLLEVSAFVFAVLLLVVVVVVAAVGGGGGGGHNIRQGSPRLAAEHRQIRG